MRIDERELFKRVMTDFILEEDPMLAMLKWMTTQLMEVEAATKVGADKNEHSTNRTTHFSGYRPRRFDTRMGTIEWEVERSYIQPQKLELVMIKHEELLQNVA